MAGGALEESRGAGQAGPSLTRKRRPCPLHPPPYLHAGEPMVPFLSFDPWWALQGRKRLSSRAERTRVGGWVQRTGGEGWQHLPQVPGRFGPGSPATPADLQDPRVRSVQAARALPGDGQGRGWEGTGQLPKPLPWCPSSTQPSGRSVVSRPRPRGFSPVATPGRGPAGTCSQPSPVLRLLPQVPEPVSGATLTPGHLTAALAHLRAQGRGTASAETVGDA